MGGKRLIVLFVVLVVLAPVLIFAGSLLLFGATGVDTTFNRWPNVLFPLGLIVSGIGCVIGAWIILRVITLPALVIFAGITFMWLAPSLRPIGMIVFARIFELVGKEAAGAPFSVTIGQFFSQLAADFANPAIFPPPTLSSNAIFIVPGLIMVVIGILWNIRRESSNTESAPTDVEITETDNLGNRRTVRATNLDTKKFAILMKNLRRSRR